MNRLTHSYAVARIGRHLADGLDVDIDLVETAGLAHDIGHPPFGHNGERALDELAQPCGGFEANAQTLRILTRLETDTVDVDGVSYGLNLTRATLDATCKYPWTATAGQRKYGAYAEDATTLRWIRAHHPDRQVCIEAQIMDWADDIANAVHDLADGIRAGSIPTAALADPTDHTMLAVEHFTTAPLPTAEDAAHDLAAIPQIRALAARPYDGTPQARATLAQYTQAMTTRMITAAVAATREHHPQHALTRYAADLVVPQATRAEAAILKALHLSHVLRDPARRARRQRQRELLAGLFTCLHHHAPDTLEPSARHSWHAAPDDRGRLRVVVDQVAALTDHQAVALYGRTLRTATRSTTTAATSGTPPAG
ncbi:deoxyguanosinetriphosphate triphosphohydrolase-like protein [Micromonospora sonchi]|uniref:Deoxyguanosinetriphosphate triphosphohydrolase-like protein n=2 Tax=Micromonospora sonchi TaxID=1763543 RepID=A0A917TNX6_9ACTN|nr:deoxyguanosinetriphosphate triphosphohydrolase-like protein [Micromonospora sonchi]